MFAKTREHRLESAARRLHGESRTAGFRPRNIRDLFRVGNAAGDLPLAPSLKPLLLPRLTIRIGDPCRGSSVGGEK
jgi:hypothetical protein